MKKLLLILFTICLISCSSDENDSIKPIEISYNSFSADSLNLYGWQGKKIMILSASKELDETTMRNWTNTMDAAYDYYAMCTNKEPNPYKPNYYLMDRATIAEVPSTCGAGCAYLGWTGIEMPTESFEHMYNNIKNNNTYDQIPFYELGRNFWFYGDQLCYGESGYNAAITTGYAVFMRFTSLEYTGVDGAQYGDLEFDAFQRAVKNLLITYLSNPSYTINNTLILGQGVSNPYNLGATDLFASFCFYLKDNYGGHDGHEWVKKVWIEAGKRPKATSQQDAIDNFIIAASIAADDNLTTLFQDWRWTISDSAKKELNSLF